MIQGQTGEWEVVIGLEVHAQVVSNSKLFSGAPTAFGAEPNTQVSPVDAGMPGMLPVLNEKCVEQAVKTGLGLNAEINHVSVFERKNYFYADLPQGYQISQFEKPIVGKGTMTVDLEDGSSKEIGITRLHLEQDAGKSLHDQDPKSSYIDLNRSGVALMEIVSEPDIRTAEEAGAYIRKLRSILRYLGTCDGNMEQGSLRADVNVSVRKPGDELGTRCEIKNLNSVRFVQQAIEYEATRQVEIIEDGGSITQETRLFDTNKGITRSMRSKEHAHDYRYFPDPDLLPIKLSDDFIDSIKKDLPELPDEKKERFISDYGLSTYDAHVLVAEKETAEFFEDVAKGKDPKIAANWVTGSFFGALNKAGLSLNESPVSAKDLGDLIDLISKGTLSNRLAKDVFDIMWSEKKTAEQVVEEKGLKQVSDEGSLIPIIDQVLKDNADKVEEYKAGKDKLYGFFVGQVMKQTQGKANPQLVNKLLKERL